MTPIQYFLKQAKEFNHLLPSSKYKDREGEFHRQLSLPSDVKLLSTPFKLKVHIYIILERHRIHLRFIL